MNRGPWILALAGCAALAAGCFSVIEPTSPRSADHPSTAASSAALGDRTAADLAGSETGGFYPLQIGNRWRYRHDVQVHIIHIGAPPEGFVDHGSIATEMVCTETVGDRSYAVEHATDTFPNSTTESWVRFRQDRTGLYELDVPTSTPATCAGRTTMTAPTRSPRAALADRVMAEWPEYRPYRSSLEQLERKCTALEQVLRGRTLSTVELALQGELTRLQYPLRPGAQWVIRADPRFVATVEDIEALNLLAGRFIAYRIRIDAPGLFGPLDHVATWYDRHGALKLVAHLEGNLTDADGHFIGKVITDEAQELEELALVEPGRF